MNRSGEGRSALEREKWLRDELSPEERAQIEASEGRESLERFKAEDEVLREELNAQLPSRVLAARVHARAAVSSGRRAAWSTVLPVLAVVMLMSAWMLREKPADGSALSARGQGTSERVKGLEPQLHVYRKHGSDVERLDDDTQVQAGDVLQLGYVPADKQHGVLVSIDGSGTVTLHVPASAQDSTRVPRGSGERLLESAYELDAAPGYERFFLVLSEQPLQASEVVASAQRLAREGARAKSAPLDLSPRVTQRSVLLHKVAP